MGGGRSCLKGGKPEPGRLQRGRTPPPRGYDPSLLPAQFSKAKDAAKPRKPAPAETPPAPPPYPQHPHTASSSASGNPQNPAPARQSRNSESGLPPPPPSGWRHNCANSPAADRHPAAIQ